MPRNRVNALVLFLCGVNAVLAPTSSTSAQGCAQPPLGLVSWWPGDGSALDIKDGNHGALVNGATFGLGLVVDSFRFDGTDDYVSIPFSSSLQFVGTRSLTISAWINTPNPASVMLIAGEPGGPQIHTLANGGLRFAWVLSGSLRGVDTPGSVVPANAWTHVAGVYDAGSQQGSVFVNGVRVVDPATGTNFGPALSSQPFQIGAFGPPSSVPLSGPFDGLIDEVDVHERALSECQIGGVFLAGSSGKCKGDTDSDGVLDMDDDCPLVANPGQTDSDADGAGDNCDCATGDPSVFALPTEVALLRLGTLGNKDHLDWCNIRDVAGTATRYDLCRGSVSELPVGSPGASETCLHDNHPSETTDDLGVPTQGEAFWYLVRGQNVCGTGTYGYRSNGSERLSAACP